MNTLDIKQGSDQWLAHRRGCFNASDAPAMMGCSPYETRSQLLHRLATGIESEVDAATQRRFDEGHRFEALARPLAEEIIGDDLAPLSGTLDVEGLSRPLGASFDGITMMGADVFEHKRINESLRYTPWDEGNGDHLPLMYRVQMEHQLIVSDAQRVLFMATRWDGETCVERRHCWYASDPALRKQIIAGWQQFEADLLAYVAPSASAVEKVIAEPVEMLPAPVVQVSGALALKDNFATFEQRLRAFLADKLIVSPRTDQDFADLDEQIKVMKDARQQLKAAEAQMLAQVQPIDQAKRTKDMLDKLLQQSVSQAEKRMAEEKDRRKGEIVAVGVKALRDHIDALNARLGQPLMPVTVSAVDFGSEIKGLRSLTSMENAIATMTAKSKIAASEVADKIQRNIQALPGIVGERVGLTPDLAQIVTKNEDDFVAVVSQRVQAQREQEQRRAAALAEQERERIRKEEADRIEREQRAAQAAAAPPAPVATPVAAPVAAPAPAKIVSIARPAADDGKRLKLGDINSRLAPIALTADGLAGLGFKHVAVDKAAKLYREADFPLICARLIEHINAACDTAPLAA